MESVQNDNRPNAQKKSLFNRLWTHPLFEKTAVWFGRFWDWVCAVGLVLLALLLFGEGSVLMGVVLLLIGAAYGFKIAYRAYRKKEARKSVGACPNCGADAGGAKFCPKCGSLMPQPEVEDFIPMDEMTLKKNKKRVLYALAAVLVVIVVLLAGGGDLMVIQDTKGLVFEQYTSQTLGDAVNSSLSRPKWSAEKIYDDYYNVTVSGFCPALSSQLSATFDVSYTGDYVYGSISYATINGEYFSGGMDLAFIMSTLLNG